MGVLGPSGIRPTLHNLARVTDRAECRCQELREAGVVGGDGDAVGEYHPNASESVPSSANVSRAAPKSNILGHRFGFVALTTTWFDVTKAIERSPSRPRPVPSDPLRPTPTTAYTRESPQ